MSSRTSPRGNAPRRWGCARRSPPGPRTTLGSRPSCTTRRPRGARRRARIIAELARRARCARAERLLGAVQIHLARGSGEPLARRACSRSWPSSMHAASSAFRSLRSTASSRTSRASWRGAVVLLGRAERGGAAQPDVELEMRIAERLRERGELGESLERSLGRRSMSSARSRASSRSSRSCEVAADGQRELHDAQDLLGRVRRRARSGSPRSRTGRRPRRRPRPSRGARAAAGSPEPARRASSSSTIAAWIARRRARRERAGRELADLLVLEAVVGGASLSACSTSSPAATAGASARASASGSARSSSFDPELDLAQVLQAEVPAEHGGLGEQRLGLVRQVRGAARDQRLDRRGHQSFGVAREPPRAVDLLDHPALAVRARHLLDDERHTFGLRVHHGGAAGSTGPPSTGARSSPVSAGVSRRPHAPDQPHAVHVGDEVHRLGDERELLRPDREHQEDRARRVRADDVAEQAQAVVVGPLQVVDQERERPRGGEGAERDGAEVERAQQPAIRGQAREPGIVLARHRVRHRASASSVSGFSARPRSPPGSPGSTARAGRGLGAPRRR